MTGPGNGLRAADGSATMAPVPHPPTAAATPSEAALAGAAALVAAVAADAGVPAPPVRLGRSGAGAAVVRGAGGPVLVVDPGLLGRPPEQAAAIVAHELGHLRHRSLDRPLLVALAAVAASVVAGSRLPAGLALAAGIVAYTGLLLVLARSRRNERAADAFAVAAGHGPGLLAALEGASAPPGWRRVAWRLVEPVSTHPAAHLRASAVSAALTGQGHPR